MLYEVKIMNANGKVKKIIPSMELSKIHWIKFQKAEDSISLTTSASARVPKWVKERLDMEFPDLYELKSSS